MNKKRFFTTILAMILVIILLVLIIVAAASPKKNTGDNNEPETFSSVERKDDTTEHKVEDENLPPVSNENEVATIESDSDSKEVENVENSVSLADSSSENLVAATDLPQSGPENILPLAIVLGSLTTFFLSYSLTTKSSLRRKI